MNVPRREMYHAAPIKIGAQTRHANPRAPQKKKAAEPGGFFLAFHVFASSSRAQRGICFNRLGVILAVGLPARR
jgi:hypothetical protein